MASSLSLSRLCLSLVVLSLGHQVLARGPSLKQRAAAFEASVRQLHQRVHTTSRDLGSQFRSRHYPRGLPRGDLRYVVDQVQNAVDRVNKGGALSAGYDLGRAVELLGLSREGFAAFTRYNFARNDGKRVEAVLRSAQNPEGAMGRKGADLVRSIYTVKLWQRYGDTRKANSALRRAKKQAAGLRVSLDRLLEIPVGIEEGPRGWGRGYRLVPGVEPGSGHRSSSALQMSGDRLPGTHPQWWTGAPRANLDFVYRKLPQLIVGRYEEHRRSKGGEAPTLRIWHVGFEDASQTFFLAASVDEAVARLRRGRPEMRQFLDKLKVEIHATDHMQRPQRQGRVFRFAETEVKVQEKVPLLLSEFGRPQVAKAKREITALEREIGTLPGQPRPELMNRLGKAGKIGQLMGRMLRLGPKVRFTGDRDRANVDFTYHLKDRSWRIEDTINGGVLNRRAGDRRRIRFIQSDITKEAPGKKHTMDLVVCTHVLPYLGLYGGTQERVFAGLKQISRSLRRGGVLLADNWSTDFIIEHEHPAFLKAMKQTGREIWITTPHRVAPIGTHGP